jgi:hypothetical protein
MLRVVTVFMPLTLPAVARDFGQWEDQPSSARQWFQRLMQPDNPYQSCCGEADAFEADTFEVSHNQNVAIITNGKGIIRDGTRVPVPNQKLKWDNGNPTGHGYLHRRKRSSLLLCDAGRRLITALISCSRLMRFALPQFAKLCGVSFHCSHAAV